MNKERQTSPTESLHAVMYVRSATYDEKMLEEQITLLQSHADHNGMHVVRRYVKGGFSGRKQGLQQKEMLDAVQTGTADFSVILMRDVSRWERFRDADVTAYYEYFCKCNGVDVRYVESENGETGCAEKETIKATKEHHSCP